jgi:hypothetical protein
VSGSAYLSKLTQRKPSANGNGHSNGNGNGDKYPDAQMLIHGQRPNKTLTENRARARRQKMASLPAPEGWARGSADGQWVRLSDWSSVQIGSHWLEGQTEGLSVRVDVVTAAGSKMIFYNEAAESVLKQLGLPLPTTFDLKLVTGEKDGVPVDEPDE